MMRRLALVWVLGIVTIVPNWAQANLLANGGLELTPPDDGGSHNAAPGWITDEGPGAPGVPGPYLGDYNNAGVTDPTCPQAPGCGAVDAADWVVYRKFDGTNFNMPNDGSTPGVVNIGDRNFWRRHFNEPWTMSLSEPSNFSHLLLEGDWQHWFQPYLGTDAGQEDNFAHLMQTVPGSPGLQYTMTGWALFENYFPGGRTNLNLDDGDSNFEDGPLSPTDTFFGLDFLDSNGNVLAGSVEIELKASGQLSNTTWQQHTLVGTAPPGTTDVRVRVTMLDGVYNPLPAPQVFQMSFVVDAFTLTAGPGAGGGGTVPEPPAWLMIYSAIAAIGAQFRYSRPASIDRR
jgi:hypothetical protein